MRYVLVLLASLIALPDTANAQCGVFGGLFGRARRMERRAERRAAAQAAASCMVATTYYVASMKQAPMQQAPMQQAPSKIPTYRVPVDDSLREELNRTLNPEKEHPTSYLDSVHYFVSHETSATEDIAWDSVPERTHPSW